jgi:hypothetical protein
VQCGFGKQDSRPTVHEVEAPMPSAASSSSITEAQRELRNMKLKIQKPLSAAPWLMVCIAWIWMNVAAMAQGFATTTVQGTMYLANGRPGAGVLQLSWPAFTTANNQAVAAGRTNVTIGADGYVSINLAPNQGSKPAGLYYTAVYHLGDGTTSTEYWVVPAAAQASLPQVRAQVMPAAQAVQAVSKGYVDQSIAELTQSLLTASGGSLSGPLFLNGDPTQPTQAVTKRYVDNEFANALPLSGGVASGPLTSVQLGAAYQVDQFPGADFGAKLQACLNKLDTVYGGTCDARNFTGMQAVGSTVVVSTANATVQLPCATIATAHQVQIAPGTRNVTLRGCAMRGASDASGSQGGTVFLYSGTGPLIRVGDPTYSVNTLGFHIDNVGINTTASTSGAATGLAAYRTQEMDLEGLYLLGNSNQTGMTLDGTGNYTGGTYQDIEFNGFGTALNAVGHQISNAATTDWVNASTFVRLHINCPTSSGSPTAGTYGIDLVQGDGNTFTGGDVEGCGTALHLGPNAQNNTIVGLRNENSIKQVVAEAGSSYNNWITGGTIFTGQLTDNGTRNSFLDTFHRSFNGLNGDWYGSQTDTTVTNHYRIGTGAGNERGLLDRYQTDYGYRWTTGLSDAGAGEQYYQVLDELNNVYRLSIGQYNHGHSSTNNQTVINAAGTGAVVLNGSANAGTGGVIFGAGGSTGGTVASVNNFGNAQFNGSLQVGGPSTFSNSTTVKNQADAEIDAVLWAGATANQKESVIYKDYTGASQWYMVKDASNNWALNSATGGLDSFKAYQSTNSGDTYVNASKSTGHIRLNYETGSGAETDIYAGSSSSLVAAFLGSTAIKFPGLAASSAPNCLQIDNSGYISNTGSACGGGSLNGTVNAGSSGQVAYYTGDGAVIAGTNSVAVAVGGTGATTAQQALQNLGAQSALNGVSSDGASGIAVNGNIAAGKSISSPNIGGLSYASKYPGQSNNGIASTFADNVRCGPSGSGGVGGCTVIADPSYSTTEQPYSWVNSTFPSPTLSHYIDRRKGYEFNLIHDVTTNNYTGRGDFFIDSCVNTSQLGYTGGATGWTGTKNNCRVIQFLFAAPGGNYGSAAKGPGGWTSQTGLLIEGKTNTAGIGEGLAVFNYKYGIGDTTNYIYHMSYGGMVAGSDEGSHVFSTGGGEAQTTYAGTIAAGGTSATSIKVTCTKDCDSPGDGRYDLDITKGVSGNATAYANPSGAFTPGAIITDISVTPSTAWGTLAADVITPTGTPIGKGSTAMTFTISSGAGNTGSFSAGDLICFGGLFHEQSRITSVSGSGPWAVTAPLRHAHEANSWVMANGPCGNFIDFTANDVASTGQTLRFPVDIIGATDAHTLQYRFWFAGNSNNTFPLGKVVFANGGTGTLTNVGGVVTIQNFSVTNSGAPYFNQPVLTISNSANSDFNGPCTNSVSSTDFNAGLRLTCTQASSTGETSASATIAIGTSQYGNTAFSLFPGAELLDMLEYDAATCTAAGRTAPCNVGTHTLEPNNVAWTAGDMVENVHHHGSKFGSNRDWAQVYNPMAQDSPGRILQLIGDGISGGSPTGSYTSNRAADVIVNYAPVSLYRYHGGTLPPIGGYTLMGAGTGPGGSGIFAYGLGMQYAPGPPSAPVIAIGCPYSGCTDPAYWYNLFNATGNGGNASLSFVPYNRSLALNAAWLDLTGAPLMSPKIQGRSNGQSASLVFNSYDSGAANHSWTITAPTAGGGFTMTLPQKAGTFATTSDLPATMVASGASHAGGLVPDPGASAGTSKFLREDGTWQMPAGSGGCGSTNNTPQWLRYLGTGDNGTLNVTSGTTNLYGDAYYTSFNLGAGATIKVTSSQGLVVHSTGTCTINGTIDARAVTAGTSTGAIGSGASGTGGGGGGGTAAGTAGKATLAFYGQGSGWPGGAGGTASGGNGGNGSALATTTNSAHMAIVGAANSDGSSLWGAPGGAGANSGGAAGAPGTSVVFICESITGTGVIDVSGGYGSPATGNNTGAGGGGGGGTIILSSHQPVSYGLAYYTAGGPGSLAGTVSYPEVLWTSGTATSPAKATLGVTGGSLDGTCTVQQAGAGYGTGAGAVVNILGGGGTQGTAVVNAVWSGGSLQSCSVTPGTSSGYTAATYTNSGAGGDGGNGIVYTFNGW